MSLWEFAAYVDGYLETSGVQPEPEPPSYDEHIQNAKRAAAMMGNA